MVAYASHYAYTYTRTCNVGAHTRTHMRVRRGHRGGVRIYACIPTRIRKM